MATQAAKKTATAPRKPAAKPAKPAAKTAKKPTSGKIKVVRDSFTMPQDDYALIASLKEKALGGGLQVKKSMLLRAGLHLLDKCNAAQLKRVLSAVTPIKTGRPKKP